MTQYAYKLEPYTHPRYYHNHEQFIVNLSPTHERPAPHILVLKVSQTTPVSVPILVFITPQNFKTLRPHARLLPIGGIEPAYPRLPHSLLILSAFLSVRGHS